MSPIFTAELHILRGTSPWMDIFWLHRTLDVLDATDSKTIAALLLAFFSGTTILAERRWYRAPAAVVDAYDTPIYPERAEDEA